MKHCLLSFLFLTLSGMMGYAQNSNLVVEINETNFPDENFREEFVRGNDSDGDGWLSEEEIAAVTRIQYLFGCDFASLQGIHYFTSLDFLYIGYDPNLGIVDCKDMQSLRYMYFIECPALTAIRISGCSALETLHVDCTHLNYFIFDDNCTSLTNLLLSCQIKTLNVSAFTNLEKLRVLDSGLTSLTFGTNNNLREVECSDAQLTSIDVSALTNLKSLYLKNNPLTSLDVSANTKLTSLDCSGNQLSSLDVSANTNLNYLDCSDNQFTSLDVSANTKLTILDCSGNQLSSLDVTTHSNLTRLSCDRNQLTTLNLSNNKKMEYLSCSENQLTSLIIGTTRDDMQRLDCSHNQLHELNLSTLRNGISYFDCSFNQLTSIVMPTAEDNSYLYFGEFYCSNNRLSELNLKNVKFNTRMSPIDCSNNQLSAAVLNQFISAMMEGSELPFRVFDAMSATEGNVFTSRQVADVKKKGSKVLCYRDGEWTDYEGYVRPCGDQEFMVDNIYYHIIGTGTVELVAAGDVEINGAFYQGVVCIPQSVVCNGTTYTVAAIAADAFDGCTDLTVLRMASTTPPAIGTSSLSCAIIVPYGHVDAYKNAEGWSNMASRIKSDLPYGDGIYYMYNPGTGKYLTLNFLADDRLGIATNGMDIAIELQDDGCFTLNSPIYGRIGVLLSSIVCIDGYGRWQIKDAGDGAFAFTVDGKRYLSAKTSSGNVVLLTDATDYRVPWQLLTKDELTTKLGEATSNEPVDATFLIANPMLKKKTKWTYTYGPAGSVYVDDDYGVAQARNDSFDFYQQLDGLPNGIYSLQVQGFYREGSIEEATALRLNNGEHLYAQLYANEVCKPLKSIFDEAGKYDNSSYNVSTELGNVPDGTSYGALDYFRKNLYKQKLTVTVTDGTLRIGVKNGTTVNEDLTMFTNFQLNYYGNLKGDVNGDGSINAQDASLIQQYVARKFGNDAEGFSVVAADVNGDGEVTAQDASLVLQYAARKITW